MTSEIINKKYDNSIRETIIYLAQVLNTNISGPLFEQQFNIYLFQKVKNKYFMHFEM